MFLLHSLARGWFTAFLALSCLLTIALYLLFGFSTLLFIELLVVCLVCLVRFRSSPLEALFATALLGLLVLLLSHALSFPLFVGLLGLLLALYALFGLRDFRPQVS